MIEHLWIAAGIWLIGSGLVFASIFLFNWVILSIKRFISDRERVDNISTPGTSEHASSADDRKRRAVLAAVALAQQQHAGLEPREFPLPPTAFVSAWQAVSRANHLRRRERGR